MIPPLKTKNGILDITLETDLEVNDDTPAYRFLYGFLKEWHNIGLIKEITVAQDGGDPTLYHYKVERTNGNEFIQTLQFTAPDDADPFASVILQPAWRLSVLRYEGPIRGQLIAIRQLYGLVSFTAVFL